MQRDYSIDVARGIACLLVVIGHIHSTPEFLHAWVYSFHMPLFFLISGIVMKTGEPLGVFAKKRVKGLLLPYLQLSIVVYLLDILMQVLISLTFNKSMDWVYVLQSFLGIFLGYRLTNYYYIMWFVLVSFLALIAANIVDRKVKNERYVIIASMAMILGNSILWKNGIVSGLPFSLDVVPMATGFILLGHSKLCKVIIEYISSKAYLIGVFACASVASSLISSMYLGNADLYSCSVGGVLPFVINALLGSIFVISVSKRIN